MWVSVDGCARWPTSPGARIPHDIGSPDSGKGTKVPLQNNLSVDEYEHRGQQLIMRRRGDIRSLVWLGGPPPHSQACSMRSIQECTSAMEVASLHRCRHQRPSSAERQTWHHRIWSAAMAAPEELMCMCGETSWSVAR